VPLGVLEHLRAFEKGFELVSRVHGLVASHLNLARRALPHFYWKGYSLFFSLATD
jgi:hypothetical protein